MKIKSVSKKILALLFLSCLLTGCTKDSECNIKDRHIHLYTKKKNNATIKNYLDSESLKFNGYDWNPEYYTLTKNDDDKFFEAKKNMFYGPDNWDYLYNVMLVQHDYLEFYYYYTEDGVMSMVDADGNVYDMPYTDTYEGWTKDPKGRGVTGKTKVVHHRYVGYRIVQKNGVYEREKSRAVDDVRDIINDYPYFEEDFVVEVDKKFDFKESELPKIKLEDIDDFIQPDLLNRELSSKTK